MATIPNKIEKLSDVEKDAFTTMAKANWGKLAGLLEYVNRSQPIGMLMFFHGSQSNLPAQPDSNYWKFMNGTAISNVNSPFNGVTAPDLRGKFFKHPGTGQSFPSQAGADTITITHSHGGLTRFASDYRELQMDNGSPGGIAAGNHQHSISAALPSAISIIPAYREVQVYMRIA